jgi:hypothetical protein
MRTIRAGLFLLSLCVASGGWACAPEGGRAADQVPASSSGQMAPRQVPPPPAGSGSGATGLVWTRPSGWVEETPSSGMRKAQYRVPGEGGDAECVVYYFGPGQGGSAEDNAARWVGQFHQPDGQPAKPALMQTTESNGVTVLRVEVAGTYSGGGPGMGSGVEKPGQRLLGAIAQGPDANWFFKLTGPDATVRAQKAAFESLLSSLKKGS